MRLKYTHIGKQVHRRLIKPSTQMVLHTQTHTHRLCTITHIKRGCTKKTAIAKSKFITILTIRFDVSEEKLTPPKMKNGLHNTLTKNENMTLMIKDFLCTQKAHFSQICLNLCKWGSPLPRQSIPLTAGSKTRSWLNSTIITQVCLGVVVNKRTFLNVRFHHTTQRHRCHRFFVLNWGARCGKVWRGCFYLNWMFMSPPWTEGCGRQSISLRKINICLRRKKS